MRGTSSSAFILLGAAAIVACSQLTAASSNDMKEFDLSPSSPFQSFMSERGTGGDKCKRDKSCAKKGGKCVEAGTCDTIEISKMCHNKNSDACTCCAKDKKVQCKLSKTCKQAGGFCVIKKQACKKGKILKKDCRCKGVWGRRGYCCVAPAKCDTSGMITIGSEQFKLFTDIVKTWAGAKTICSDEGLVMAEPQDPPTVVGYLWDTYYKYFWLGASGNGVSFVWNSGGELSSNSPHWTSGHPSGKLDYCLETYSGSSPYYASKCSTENYVICQCP